MSRAGVVLSAAAVATSFFGSQALDGSGLSGWSWLAIFLFGIVALLLVGVMTPGRMRDLFGPGQEREGLAGFAASPAEIVGGYVEAKPPWSLARTYRDVSLHMELHWEENERVLVRRVDLRFRLAALLLFAEIAVWVVELA